MKTLEVINGSDTFTFYDNANGVILRQFDGFEYAPIKVSLDQIPKNEGAVFLNSKFSKRVLAWSGDFVGPTVFTLRQEMLLALRQTGTIKLLKFTTYDDLDLQIEADISKIILPYTNQIHSFLIEAAAPDWRFYSQALSSTDIVGTGSVTNAGNEDSEPTLTIVGPGTDFTVINSTTGEQFTLTVTLTAGQEVEINTKNKTVLLGGISNYYRYFDGDFPKLSPGANSLELQIVSGDTAATKLVVSHRDAYRGI